MLMYRKRVRERDLPPCSFFWFVHKHLVFSYNSVYSVYFHVVVV